MPSEPPASVPPPADGPAPARGLLARLLPGHDAPTVRSLWQINGVYWFVVLYCGVWILLRSRGVGGPDLAPVSQAAAACVFVLAAANLYLRTKSVLRRGGYGEGHPDRFGWLFTVLDLSTVATALRLTGGIESGLWPVLFVIVVAETVLEKPREAALVQSGAALALALGTVPFPIVPGPWMLEMATRLVFLLAVSIVTRRLRENADGEKAQVAALRAELALSEERSKLSREVHDGVGNALAASVLRLEVTARALEKQRSGGTAADGDAPALLRDEAQCLREAMNSVRDWTFFKKPWSADGGGDGGASPSARLAAEGERLSRRTGLPITVQGAEAVDALPAPSRLALLRIVQEALTNAAKYAQGATRAEVTLQREGRWLVVRVADDGCGFDPGALSGGDSGGAGLGLSSMRERAEGIGGALHIDAAPGAGVAVTARLPAPP